MISVLNLENILDGKTSENRTWFLLVSMAQNKGSGYNIGHYLYPCV